MGNKQIYISALLAVCIVPLCHAVSPCPKLSLLPGTVVECNLPKENRMVDCVNETSTKGTIGKYRCEKDQTFSDGILKCGCKGRWRGIQMFNDFMSNCNISDYSNSGPAELNLTETEIHQLALPAPEEINTKDYQEDGVAFHNLYRKIHNAPFLELNQTVFEILLVNVIKLSDAAQKWAESQVEEGVLKTQPWSDRWYSQNLYRVAGSGIDAREAVKLAVAAWYQGAYHYDWEAPSGQSAFTQLVWKSTTDVGLGVAQKGNQTVVVANYYPPGNVIVSNPNIDDKWAWFRINVLPPNLVDGNNTQSQNMSASSASVSVSTFSTAATTATTTTETGTSIITTSTVSPTTP